MEWCWEYDATKRPKFSELFKIFANDPEYLNLKELLMTQDLQKLGLWFVLFQTKVIFTFVDFQFANNLSFREQNICIYNLL